MSNYSDSSFDYNDSNTSWYKTFELIKQGSTVLDVGCSSGTFGAELIKKKKCIVDGIEINEDDVIKAKKNLRRVYQLNIETDKLDIRTAYDAIFMGDVIEHLARPAHALEKIKQLLKKDGVLIFSIPNITHMSVRLMLLAGKIEYGKTGLLDETHLHFYNTEEVYRVFNEAGYRIDKFDYTVNDIPVDLAKNKLAELGLTPNKKFNELLQSTNAAAYQFVGVAVKGKNGARQQLPASSPDNIVGAYIDEMKADYEKVIKDLKLNLKETQEDRDRIIKDRDRIQAEMSQTITHRTLQYARRLKAKKKGR